MRRFLVSFLVFAIANPLSIAQGSEARYLFPVADCKSSYTQYHHDYPAADIFTRDGCTFVSPVDGVVTEVSRQDSWNGRENLGSTRGGKFVAILGDDGVRYYGSHLRSVAKGIAPGVRVNIGSILGRIGSSGSARGTKPHLHFGISWPTEDGIWWVRRGMISPYRFLQSWQSGEMLSPRKEVMRMVAKVGEIPKQPKN